MPSLVDEQIGKQIGKQMGKQIGKQIGKQMGKQMGKQVGKQIGKQIGHSEASRWRSPQGKGNSSLPVLFSITAVREGISEEATSAYYHYEAVDLSDAPETIHSLLWGHR